MKKNYHIIIQVDEDTENEVFELLENNDVDFCITDCYEID